MDKDMKANKIIAVDFDGTLCENDWPDIGEPKKDVIAYLKERQAAGDKLILWTCRVGEMLEIAVKWCIEQALEFDAVNENLPEVIKDFGSDTRKIFANEYIDDRNVLLSSCCEKSKMKTWAEREVEIACEYENPNRKPGEWDYGCACYESALKAYNSLLEDGHSGFSIGTTKHILNRLIEGKPLTPIEDTDDVWNDISRFCGGNDPYKSYQCKRMSSLFKYVYDDGRVEYKDVDRFCCYNKSEDGASYHSGLVDRVMYEKIPITMPYCPGNAIKVICEEYLTDRKNGDYDTVGILYYICPENGVKEYVNRFFIEDGNDFKEISVEEYHDRIAIHKAREKAEAQSYEPR